MRMMMVMPAMLGRKAHLDQGYRQPIPFVNAGLQDRQQLTINSPKAARRGR